MEKSVYRESEFFPENIKKLIQKLDWAGLYKTVAAMGEENFPPELMMDLLEDEKFLKRLHRIILDVLHANYSDAYHFREAYLP